jgi:membrane protein DedA with SNARE-associated domain
MGLAVAATAALVGDSLGYWLGRAGGPRVLARLGSRARFTPGCASVVFGRFVVGARVLMAPVAGLTRMPFRRFVVFDAIGCFVWAGIFILIGYASGVRLEAMQAGLHVVSLIAQIVIAAAIGAWLISRFIAVRRSRAAA